MGIRAKFEKRHASIQLTKRINSNINKLRGDAQSLTIDCQDAQNKHALQQANALTAKDRRAREENNQLWNMAEWLLQTKQTSEFPIWGEKRGTLK